MAVSRINISKENLYSATISFVCFVLALICVVLIIFYNKEVIADEQRDNEDIKKANTILPYQIPTFTGEEVNWSKIEPSIEPIKHIDGDYIQKTVTNCYPEKPWGINISVNSGAQYRIKINREITTSNSSPFYAGIVFNMPLYSGSEVDMLRTREYKRRIKTAETIALLMNAVSLRRKAQRMMGLYLSLEERSKERVRQGIVSVNEQIMYLEKVANTQSDLDSANSMIQGSRLSLVAQCRPEVAEQVNNIILSEIN